jgi:hypothetical protein
MGSSIAMSGVLWMVPQTTRSDVKQLAEALHHQRHHFVTECVWIGLFCIP